MTEFLIKRCIKNSENVTDPAVREAYGRLSGIVGIITNILLAASKVIIGLLFSSIAIVADGINNLSDAGSSIVALIGFKLAGIPEDSGHPYGHARYEYIAGLIISVIIIILGLQLLREAAGKILDPDPLSFSAVSVAVLVIAIAVKLWQMGFYKVLGEKIHSTTIKAVSKDSRNDAVSTGAVLLSILVGKLTGFQLDGIMGALVAIFILYSGFSLVKETVDPLLGKAPDRGLVEALETKILSYPGALGIHDLVVHEYGPGRIFASAHVEVDAREDVMKSHDLIDTIERDVIKDFHMHFVIHMDPIVTEDENLLRIKEQMEALLKEIDPRIRFHDFRYVPGPTHTNLIFDVVVPMRFHIEDEELKEQIQQRVREKIGPSYYTVITVDKDYLNQEG